MDDTRWVKFVSWHVVPQAGVSRANRPLDSRRTRCGLPLGERLVVDERAGNEKTCESCLRWSIPK